jgi:D-amino-acid dehydrogenase
MKVVVAGAGVIGLWCARELAAAGADVIVVGPSRQPTMSTPASAGWVVPVLSHPLAGPGLVSHTARQVLHRQAAFSFRGMTPALAGWLWRFLRSGSESQFRAGVCATLDLAGPCQQQYHALRDAGHDFELHHDGLLMVARTDAGRRDAQHLVETTTLAGYDGKNDALDASAIRNLEPALSADVTGGVHARDEMHIHPGQLTDALTAAAIGDGIEVRNATVESILPAAGARWTIVTSDGPLTADKVVLAAGYWSKRLAATVGMRLPLQCAAGVSVTALGPRPPRLPLKLLEANVALTPFSTGVRLAGRFTLGPPPTSVSRRHVRLVVAAAQPYLGSWRPREVTTTYVGLRPVTPDSLPLIGELPGRRGLIAATGHGMLGLTLAPGTAAEVRHQVTTGAPSDIGAPFALTRFPALRTTP